MIDWEKKYKDLEKHFLKCIRCENCIYWNEDKKGCNVALYDKDGLVDAVNVDCEPCMDFEPLD